MIEWSKEVFSKNLKMYMKKRGITQKEIAEIIGVSAPTVSDWVKKKKYPRIDKIEKLAEYFGILKSDLIEEKKEVKQDEKDKINSIYNNIKLKMYNDKDFFEAVSLLYILDKEKLKSIISLLK